MKKIKMVVQLEYDESIIHGDDQDGIDWFYDEILHAGVGQLLLHSNSIGDTVGKVCVISVENPYNTAVHSDGPNAASS
jgi:hypothetical protein